MAESYPPASAPGSASAEERDLLEAGLGDLRALAAFGAYATALEDLNRSAFTFAHAAGHAARELGLTLDELLTLVRHRATVARLVADYADLEALSEHRPGGGQP